jgi:2-polyprenyl-3-methyl-5-hydroxy-6-metoxy-1,4-benzoquinol methylase
MTITTLAAAVCELCGGAQGKDMFANLLRCSACGHVYLKQSARPQPDVLYADYYDADGACDPLTAERSVAIVRRWSRWRHPGRLLDVGCGAGYLLDAARSEGWSVTGVELSAGGAALSRRRGHDVAIGDYLDLRYDREQFDAISMVEVIEHVAKPMLYLHKAHAELEPGGLLYITTPNFNGLSRRLLGERFRIIAPEHWNYFTAVTLRRIAVAAGFTVKRIECVNLDTGELRQLTARSNNTVSERMSQNRESRRRLYARPFGRAAIQTANQVLNQLRLGDTIKLIALKA